MLTGVPFTHKRPYTVQGKRLWAALKCPLWDRAGNKAASALCIQIAHCSALLPQLNLKHMDHCIHITPSNVPSAPHVGVWPCSQSHHSLHRSYGIQQCQHQCLLKQLLVGEGLKKAMVRINLSLQSALTVTLLNTQHPTQLSLQAQAYCISGGCKLMAQKCIYQMIQQNLLHTF